MICKHVKQQKISFKEFLKIKFQGGNIYFHCRQCNKVFIAKRSAALGSYVDIFVLLLCMIVEIFSNGFQLDWYIKVLIFLICFILLCLVLLLYEWKHISYEEINL